jgi:hypothetical protein
MNENYPWPDLAGFDPQNTPHDVALANAKLLYRNNPGAAPLAVAQWQAAVKINRQKWEALIDAATDEGASFDIGGRDCTPIVRNLATGLLMASGKNRIPIEAVPYIKSAGRQIHDLWGLAGMQTLIEVCPKPLQHDVEDLWDGIGGWKA